MKNTSSPRPYTTGNALYQPKSERLFNSPYLYPPFQPQAPDNGMRLTRSARKIKKSTYKPDNYVPYNPPQWRPSPEAEQSYLERIKYFAKRDKNWNDVIVRKYTKKAKLPPYQVSMKGTYKKIMLDATREKIAKEDYETRRKAEIRRKRMIKLSEESMRAHEEIMKRHGIQPPQNYNTLY